MSKNKTITIAFIILLVLGVAMLYLGGFHGEKIILPPILTGIGFFVIAWVFKSLQTK